MSLLGSLPSRFYGNVGTVTLTVTGSVGVGTVGNVGNVTGVVGSSTVTAGVVTMGVVTDGSSTVDGT